MRRILFLAIFVIPLIGCQKNIKYKTVIQNIHLFDGFNDRGLVNVGIHGDTIAAISEKALKGDSIIDATGKYIIPGLVNAHVHASSIQDLKEGYPLGILTLLNMHTGLEDRELEWKQISKDSLGFSQLFGSGHAATIPGGHPTQFSPDMETITDSLSIEDWVNHRIKNNVDYIKIIREHHEWMGYPPLPSLDYEQIGALIKAAHQQGYKAVVHANTVSDMAKIAQYKPDGFVHMLDYKEDFPVPDSYYETLKESGVFVVPTGGISLKPMTNAPPFIKEWVSTNLLDANQRASIIKTMHEYGIPIVAGTDAQEGQMNFADDYYLELELYKMAGLSNLEILKAATGNAAKAFGLPFGTLEVGGKANFVILNENPIEDIENLKTIEQVWKHGKTN